ncbi:hypothetical protein D3C80_1563860 [compost metagenome]
MAQLQQVAGCGIAALEIVDNDRIGVIAFQLVVDQHIGNAPPLQLHKIIILLHRREQNQPVYPVLLDQIMTVAAFHACRDGDGQEIPVQRKHLVQLFDHCIKEGILQRRDNQADDPGLAAGQAAGSGTRPVVQLLDRIEHPLPVVFPHRSGTV